MLFLLANVDCKSLIFNGVEADCAHGKTGRFRIKLSPQNFRMLIDCFLAVTKRQEVLLVKVEKELRFTDVLSGFF